MGYGSNPEVVAARFDMLEELDRGHPTAWTCEPNRAATQKLVNQIREALYIANLHPDLYPGLAAAYKTFSIHLVAPGRVEARIKAQPLEVKVNRADLNPIPDSTPTHGIVGTNQSFKVVPQVGLHSAHECIQSWQQHLPSSDPLLLQRTELPYEELLILFRFCQSNTPRLMMLVGDGHITMSLYEAGVADIAAWHPNPDPAAPEEFEL